MIVYAVGSFPDYFFRVVFYGLPGPLIIDLQDSSLRNFLLGFYFSRVALICYNF